MKLLHTSSVISVLLLAHAGCSDDLTFPLPPPAGMRAGVLEYYGDTAHVTVPAAAVVGESVNVRVLTWGDGCLRKGETQVAVAGRTVTVRPYDLMEAPGVVCNLILLAVEHEAVVQISESGDWEINFHGVKAPGEEPIMVRRYIRARD